jgi:hypothetical protein
MINVFRHWSGHCSSDTDGYNFFKEMCVDISFLKPFLKKLLYHLHVNLGRESEREREKMKNLVLCKPIENIYRHSFNTECAYESNHTWKK